jgi:hypothetical protein
LKAPALDKVTLNVLRQTISVATERSFGRH